MVEAKVGGKHYDLMEVSYLTHLYRLYNFLLLILVLFFGIVFCPPMRHIVILVIKGTIEIKFIYLSSRLLNGVTETKNKLEVVIGVSLSFFGWHYFLFL